MRCQGGVGMAINSWEGITGFLVLLIVELVRGRFHRLGNPKLNRPQYFITLLIGTFKRGILGNPYTRGPIQVFKAPASKLRASWLRPKSQIQNIKSLNPKPNLDPPKYPKIGSM